MDKLYVSRMGEKELFEHKHELNAVGINEDSRKIGTSKLKVQINERKQFKSQTNCVWVQMADMPLRKLLSPIR